MTPAGRSQRTPTPFRARKAKNLLLHSAKTAPRSRDSPLSSRGSVASSCNSAAWYPQLRVAHLRLRGGEPHLRDGDLRLRGTDVRLRDGKLHLRSEHLQLRAAELQLLDGETVSKRQPTPIHWGCSGEATICSGTTSPTAWARAEQANVVIVRK